MAKLYSYIGLHPLGEKDIKYTITIYYICVSVLRAKEKSERCSLFLIWLFYKYLLAVQDIQTTGGVSYLAALEVVVSV